MKLKTVCMTATLVAAITGTTTRAQGQAPAAAGAPAPEVQVTTTKLGGNVYAVEGQGGRATALVGPDGVLLVDAQFPAVTEKIMVELRRISDGRVRILINTHVHGDHTGGNENFGKMGAVIMARPALRARLLNPAPAANGQPTPPTPAAGLPLVTYDQPMTLRINGEEVRILPLPPSHTDGDTAVKFVTADVLATGDVFRSVGYPNIDRANGGTLKGLLESMQTFLDNAGPNTKVSPGHGAVTNRAAIVAHRDTIVTVRDRVAKAMMEGKTTDQIVASKPTADLDMQTGNAMASADRFVQQVVNELRPASAR
jgi:glyoxylase-like metal-dependent hydrolase (beta-lactamase superfamily II)